MSDEEIQKDTAGRAQDKSIEDLKAKLGIKTKSATQAPEEPKRKAPTADDFSLGLGDAPRPSPTPKVQSVKIEEDFGDMLAGAGGLDRKTLVAFVVVALILSAFGVFFGGALKGRAIENQKTREAQHLMEYFTESRVAQIGAGGELILDVVDKHVQRIHNVVDMLSNAADAQAMINAEKALEDLLVASREYRDRKPFYTFEQVFPGVVYNGEVASEVVRYVAAVKQLYDETVILALEGDTLDRVTEMEQRGEEGNKQVVYVESFKKENGEAWLKGTWISRIDYENPRQVDGKTAYAMLPIGQESKGFVAGTDSLAEIDVTPIAMDKSIRYKGAILARVKARVGTLKILGDLIQFDPLKEQIQRFANRSEYITIF